MSRFKPLAESDMTEAQREAVRELASGPRGKFNPYGPTALLLRSPDLMSRAQKLGAYLRYSSALPPRLNEFAIIVTARHWSAQLVWFEHQPLALKAGLDPMVADDLAQGKHPRGMQEDEAAVYQFLTELHQRHGVSDATFATVTDKFGERGVIDLIGVTGYYSMLSMALNTAQQPLPGNAAPPLPVLK